MTAEPAAAPAPVLETERLRLEAPGLDHFPAFAALWADAQVTRHIGGRPSTEEESWRRLLQLIGLWASLGYGYWALIEKGSGRFLGAAGFGDFHRAIEPRFHGVPEAGWVLAPSAQGRGLATEAVARMLAWADERWPRTVCIIDPENAPSVAVAEKCGYRLLARTAYNDAPTLLFERLRP